MANSSFIKAYGLHWERNEVDWRRNGSLLGRIGGRVDTLRLVDFWQQTGIYVLHDAHGAYYVGQAERQALGERLRQHTTDTHAQRWDRFSWFGFNAILTGQTKTGIRPVKAARPKHLLGDVAETISDVEALLIMALGTNRTGNKHTEKFRDAECWQQVWDGEREDWLSIAQRQVEEERNPWR